MARAPAPSRDVLASHSASRSRDRSQEGGGEHDGVYSRAIVLWTHQPPNFSTHSFVLNPAYGLPQVSDAELLMVTDEQGWDAMCATPSDTPSAEGTHHHAHHTPGGSARAARTRRALVFTPQQALADTEVISKQNQLQLSIAKSIAGLYGLANRTEAVLCRTSRAAHTIEHVELYFKDQYIGRSDMWRLSTSLVDQCVYVGQKIQMPAGMRATVGRLYVAGQRALSGYVAPSTKAVFRSESAKYDILIQMSQEMWEFDEGGEIYYEKVLHGFLPDLLAKWDTIGTNHVVSIVLFTRVHYTKEERARLEGLPVQQVAATGQLYVDYYKVIIDLESNTHWPSVMRVLKEEFFRFQHDILLQPRRGAAGHVAPPAPNGDACIDAAAIGGRVILGELAHAHEGNVLEAINLALNPFDQHYIDRDLTRTGFELVVITAGTGHFHVDKALLRTTTQRMSEIGLSVDLVCLAQMPLHTAPIFYFRSAPAPPRRESVVTLAPGGSSAKALARSPSVAEAPLYTDTASKGDEVQTFYIMPYWINCSFYSQDPDRPYRADRFVPRCKMDAMRMLDLLGSGHQDISIPYLDLPPDAQTAPSAAVRRAARERFDADVFRSVARVPAPGVLSPPAGPAVRRTSGKAPTPGITPGVTPGATTPAAVTPGAPPGVASLARARALSPAPTSTSPTPTGVPGTPTGMERSVSRDRGRSTARMSPSRSPSPRSVSRVRDVRSLSRVRPASVASSRASYATLLETAGKAPASVAETVTSLVATPSEVSVRGARPPPPSRLRSVLAKLGWGASGRAVSRATTNARDASELISTALARGRDDAPAKVGVLAVRAADEGVQLAEAAPLLFTHDDDLSSVSGAPVGSDDDADGRAPLVNPSNPRTTGGPTRDALLLRWQHVFLARTNHHAVKWWSMTSPACLPLTTQHLPSAAELQSAWEEYPYSISVYSDAMSFLLKRGASTSPALAILREMCAQRLSQGFQFVERPVPRLDVDGAPGGGRQFVLRHPAELLRPGNFSTGDPIYLSTTNQIHCITYHRQAGMIQVKRYLKKTPYNTAPVPYRCCIWPRYFSGYQAHGAHFAHPDPHAYNWTYLDSLIAGYEESLTEATRYWRARFVLVPAEGSPPAMTAGTGERLSDEEVRLLGTDRLAELFARAEYVPPGAPRPERGAALRFLPTTLDASSSMLDEQFVQALLAINRKLSQRRTEPRRVHREARTRPLATLATELVASAAELQVHDRLWQRVLYRDTFTGADLVSYLCRAYDDVRTRDDAVQLGRQLQAEGYVEHVLGVHGFLDGHYFYRLGARARRLAGDAAQPARVHGAAAERRELRRLRMSRSMLIDLDPGRKSDRAEIAVLHHDLAHNAENGFNFQIHWLGTTARLIEDVVQAWTRAVERYGLRLIEAPIGQIKDVGLHNPFQAPLPIALALPPPARAEYAHLVERTRLANNDAEAGEPADDTERWLYRHVLAGYATQTDQLFEIALLRHFGFVLDQEAASRYPTHVQLEYSSRPTHFDYSQFVHRSGIAFVQVRSGRDGFLWLHNRLFTSHIHTPKPALPGKPPAPPPDPDELRRTFQRFCDDRAALDAFYRSVWNALERLAGPTHAHARPGAPASAPARAVP